MSFTKVFGEKQQRGVKDAQRFLDEAVREIGWKDIEKAELYYQKSHSPEEIEGFTWYCDSLMPIHVYSGKSGELYKGLLGKFGSFRKVVNAYEFSLNKHQGQTRKKGEDYFEHHILLTTQSLISFLPDTSRQSIDMVCGMLLHDTVEDTITSLQEIEDIFGYRVKVYVDGMTHTTVGNHKARHEATVVKLLQQPLEVRILKIFDILNNGRTMWMDDPKYGAIWYSEKLELVEALTYRFLEGTPQFLKESLIDTLTMGKTLSQLTKK